MFFDNRGIRMPQRPIVVGNLAHGLIVTLVMLRWLLDGSAGVVGWGLTGGFTIYTICFGVLLYRPPWGARQQES